MNDYNDYTVFLFARASFLEGMARLLDFGNTLTEYNESTSPEQADYFALRADWRAVGQDLQRSVATYEHEVLKAR